MGNNGYINWLHLSDLHIGKEGNKWIDDTIRQELISYLDNIGTIDFILITGDMIDRGNLEDDNVCKAAESLIKNLKQKVQKPIIFCIGNHDYIRTDERFDKLTLWESLDITEKKKKQTEYSQKLKEDFEKIVKLYNQWCCEHSEMTRYYFHELSQNFSVCWQMTNFDFKSPDYVA